jgi:hypothetical protein
LVQRDRLASAGRTDLAVKVEWVAKTKGPSAGFDIASFRENGDELFIEVKTTVGPIGTPFYISSAEVLFGTKNPDRYEIHRVFDVRQAPEYYVLRGDPTISCELKPSTFHARPASRPDVAP